MKHTYKIFAALAFAVVCLAGCTIDNPFEEITDLDLARCLEPTELSARISQGDVVTFNWNVTKDAEQYLLEIYSDEALTSLVTSETIPAKGVPASIKLVADEKYYFRVQAQSGTRAASKWAVYDKSIKTYAVKSNLFMKVAERTSTSLTFTWTPDPEVDRIELMLGDDVAVTYDITESDASAGCATVEGLVPSTNYVANLMFKSANRSELSVWTMPDASAATPVSTSAALEQAIKDGATILLKMEGSPYTIGTGDTGVDITKPVTILGEESADGTKPVIYGCISISPDFAGGDIYFEGVEFNGNKYAAGHAISAKNGGSGSLIPVNSITYKNCKICYYSKGLTYEWTNTVKLGSLNYESCEIAYINGDGNGGGDGIDFRNASEVGALNLIDNTIYQSFRTFVRIDKGTWGPITIKNNTMMDLCFIDNTNNAGIVAINADASLTGDVVVANNLVLYSSAKMNEKATFGSANAKYYSAEAANVQFSNNWFYNLASTFFTDNYPQAAVTSAGGRILDADPCWNAAGGFFNLTNTDAAAAKVGASKWWISYVEEPEDLTMTTLEGGHVWDFSNAKYFVGDITRAKVRDGLLQFVSGTPLYVQDGAMYFTAASPLDKKGAPVDGYIAFQVDQPGSVYIKTVDPEGFAGNHVVIAVGPAGSSSCTVKGGAATMADSDNPQKILISDITEESLVYIYASGPIGISQLAWSLDQTQVNTALPTPQPVISAQSATQGDAAEFTVAWEEVENAGSYSVVFSGKTYNVTDNWYTIGSDVVKMLDAGSYMVKVYANPAEDDIYNTQSSEGTVAFAILPKGGGEEQTEFIVSSVDDLVSAIGAGKTDITLAFADKPYEIGAMTVTTPLHLKGQKNGDKMTPVVASFTLSGEIGGSFILENLDITNGGVSVIIDDKTTAAPVADTVAILGSYIHGTKAIYDNSGKAVSDVQYVIFKGNLVDNCSAGADFIDLRAGAHHNLVIVANTFANSCRTFLRTDAGHEMNNALIRNNTFYKVATNEGSKDNNGVFHLRSAAGAGLVTYKVENNFFYSILIDAEPGNAAGFPKFRSKGGITPYTIANNYFYNIEEREDKAAYSWWAYVTKEEGTAFGGAVIPAGEEPCKDPENGDYTLVNAVAMNAGVGDPRWNPMAGGRPSSEITVENVADFLTAISAGKATITLAPGDYDFTALTEVAEVSAGKLNVVSPLNIIGQEGARIIGGFVFKEGCTSFSMKGVALDGGSTVDNAFEVADATVVMKSFELANGTVTAFKNRLFYMNQTGEVQAASFKNLVVTGVSGAEFTSGDFIDVRKGTFNALKVQGCTFANAVRTFTRIDAAVVLNSVLVKNNTFYNICYADSKDNNGIFHIRATSLAEANFDVQNNLFASFHRAVEEPSNGAGYPKLVSTNSASKIPTFRHNYFYDLDVADPEAYCFWTKGRITAEEALAGHGVMLTADPFAAAADGNFTLVSDLAASENIGAPMWNTTKGRISKDGFEVASVDELLQAISAGKTSIALKYGEYNLADAVDATVADGVLTVASELTLKGIQHCGLKPVLKGGFKLAAAEGSFVLDGLELNGAIAEDKKVGNMIEAAGCQLGKLVIRDCYVTAYGNRFIYMNSEDKLGVVEIKGVIANEMGTGGDFFDIRKGTVNSISFTGNTFSNGIRTFMRVDANVVCGAIKVMNNTFWNVGYVDSKDNNGIMHIRSTAATADTRQIVVARNIFAGMHRAVEQPSNAAAGFPHLISKASAAIAVPTISDNIFFDIDATGSYSWWTYMPEDNVGKCGTVLDETPFTSDPATGKFNVKAAYKGFGDNRW